MGAVSKVIANSGSKQAIAPKANAAPRTILSAREVPRRKEVEEVGEAVAKCKGKQNVSSRNSSRSSYSPPGLAVEQLSSLYIQQPD